MKKGVFSLLSVFYIVLAQQSFHFYGSWDGLFIHVRCKNRWRVNNAFHVRRVGGLSLPQQNLWRPSLQYQFNAHFAAFLGYSYIEHFPYRTKEVSPVTVENNIWEQWVWKHVLKKHFAIKHRFRLEHRWRGGKFSNRFRYRFIVKYPKKGVFYVKVYGEWFLARLLQDRDFNQQRYYLGVGWRRQRLEFAIGYLHRAVKRKERWEQNHLANMKMAIYFGE